MVISDFNISIKDGILIVTSKKNVTLDDLKEIHASLENSTKKTYQYGMYRDLIGYYDGYDFIRDISVYCGTLNEATSIEKIKNYRNGKQTTENSSS